ncbi:ferric-dicitrate binding protein FerR, regulates iron transport through sigma-19 [Pedobacter steynii]|uniref:Ferric-dicitrate binding protein FerR, regulates iron transport through sigma-19 n=1 Tax=Pedobacter steynii TaxID=430522 RepID=A0A1G9KEL1_9SPHI|nr:FecR domain-containing protein [Pedobacter steynii]NQX38528.1 FecR domain-containing protein [Pedobacter steynii]SDL48069.1 ferric-dicitrate binding protein FerR, regulates iron transport through sigma-19 [Pedobacter steynii]
MTDELLIKFLLKETSEEENTAIQEWLAADPANISSFIQFEKIWEAGKTLAPQSKVDEEQAWNKFREKTSQLKKEAVVLPLKKNYTWLKVAAVFVLAIGAWTLYQLMTPVAYTNLTASNEVLIKTLPDGSELTINKNSQLSYASDFKNDRSVRLDSGEVFFNVAHDKTRPFVIEADQVSVEVVGTSFNVKHSMKKTEVIVETGIVKVRLGNEEIRLIKGERVSISNNSKKLVKAQSEDQLYNYYRSKLFIFKGTPLSEVAEVLNEAYGVHISVDPAAEKHTLFTTLKLTSTLDYNLDLICDALQLTRSGNQQDILLSNKK